MQHPEKSLNDAILAAVDKIVEISSKKPNERLPKEAIVQCEIYRHYTNKGYVVHPEAGYFPANNGLKWSCDLRIIADDKQELWLEIKMARDGAGLSTKLSEEKKKWEKDGSKLDSAPKKSRAAFVLIALTEDDPKLKQRRFFQEVNNFWGGGYNFTEVVTKPIVWPSADVNYVTAWYWTW